MSGLRNLKVLKSKEVKEIKQLIEKQFGAVVEGNLVFFLNTKENKIFISNQDIGLINFNDFNVNSIGLYLGELYNNEFRPSVEGAQLIAKTATKNILEVSREEALQYLQGKDIEKQTELQGFIILKCGSDIIGSTRKKEGKLLNFFPKQRRLPESVA
ncbi:hypothetical protein J4457_04130 [Candidatus Woesearchaeota archaeon]|nr:hypothetical protein [Candidatus Woesearchaeota archaeon]